MISDHHFTKVSSIVAGDLQSETQLTGCVQQIQLSRYRSPGPYSLTRKSVGTTSPALVSALDPTTSSSQIALARSTTFLDSLPHDQTFTLQTSQPHELNNTHHLDGTRSYLLSDDFLAAHSLRIHSYFKTLHCMICNLAIPPKSMPEHMHHEHRKRLDKAEISTLEMAVQKYGVRDGKDIWIPAPGGSPVEGLTLYLDGYACIACTVCKQNYLTFKNHWSKEHKDVNLPVQQRFKKATLQTFFIHPSQFFSVDPALTSLSKFDPFYLYLTKEVPRIETTTIFPPPTSPKELPPLLQAMAWHLHLADYISNKSKVDDLMTLKQLPSIQDKSALGKLRSVISEYMRDVSKLAHHAPFSVRCILMEWPRFVSFENFNVSEN
jgi:hypothetical protein